MSYVIMERSFEYNDEIYETNNYGEDEGSPVGIIKNLEEAKKKQFELTKNRVNQTDSFCGYYYSPDEFFSERQLEILKNHNIVLDEDDDNYEYDWELPNLGKDTDEFVREFDDKFYYIEEVEDLD